MKKNTGISNHTGIILIPHHSGYMSFDKELGRIYCSQSYNTIAKTKALIGSQVQYTILPRKLSENRYSVESQEIITAPHYSSLQQVLFVHHIIELCVYSIPLGAAAPEIFELLRIISCPIISPSLINRKTQVVFLIRLLMMLGIMIERHPLSSFDIETIFNQPLTHITHNPKNLVEWVIKSIKAHPSYSLLKTAHFLETLLT